MDTKKAKKVYKVNLDKDHHLGKPGGAEKLGNFYKNFLLDNVIPFWLRNGLDKENGGIFTCLNRDGSLMDSDKSVWF
jgi:hypothetical protein